MADLTRMAVSATGEDTLRTQYLQTLPPQNGEIQPAIAVAQTEQPDQKQEQGLDKKEQDALPEAVQNLDKMIKPLSIGLNIQRLDDLNRTYIELYDRETGEVIREIPSKQIIEMQRHIREMQGLLFDKFS